jgi:hypothetical protein
MNPRRTMTGEQFTRWLAAMIEKGRAASEAECGRLLDANVTTVWRMKANGVDRRTALACSALLRGLKPYK